MILDAPMTSSDRHARHQAWRHRASRFRWAAMLLTAVLAGQLSALAADPTQSVSRPQRSDAPGPPEQPIVREPLAPWPADRPMRRDPVSIMSVRWQGEELLVRVGYGGGCARHEFGYDWSPNDRQLIVLHDAHGDSCEAFISQEFVVQPLPPVHVGEVIDVVAGTPIVAGRRAEDGGRPVGERQTQKALQKRFPGGAPDNLGNFGDRKNGDRY